MLFSSVIFILKFLPITFCLYFVLKNIRFRNFILLSSSIIFYAWGEPLYIFLMLASVVINYLFGLLIDRYLVSPKHARLLVAAGVVANLLILIYFKYFGFILQNLNELLGLTMDFKPVVMPIGISFYSFQSISYLVDVYRKEVHVQRSVINLGLYISFFPQLIAGPIVRYKDIDEQIQDRKITLDGFTYGVQRFIIGLSKKVLIANTLGEVADKIFLLPHNEMTVLCSWLGIVCYAFQIFFDFSGYSDMAIGLGRMFGFHFLENFNFPYSAKSIKDFWHRWHISLSTWFRDYLYIPLGGNRKGNLRTHMNLLIVFFITGLWHGASWNFIIWGLFHGLFLLIERNKPGDWIARLWAPVRHSYVILVVLIGWVFFRSSTLEDSFSYLKMMFGFHSPDPYPFELRDFLNQKVLICIAIAALLSFPFQDFVKSINPTNNVLLNTGKVIIIIGLFLLALASIASDTYNPFIYYRF